MPKWELGVKRIYAKGTGQPRWMGPTGASLPLLPDLQSLWKPLLVKLPQWKFYLAPAITEKHMTHENPKILCFLKRGRG